MMWHPIIAFTDHRMIIGGERQKGMLMVEYDTESYEKDDILSNRTECDGHPMGNDHRHKAGGASVYHQKETAVTER